ncbi:FadR/GntR family transcriptional regulator [Sphingobium sp. HWE2-09]|uniref:FadR/GntR family transcriptional regulator n=1 Tax=Sphingobium sp. HWE2-09 TaxID=3108390 RepID=UPI002DD35771|nr:FCD domain-containing protein [Sphingobium sp. HWE2-09]
MNVRKQAAAATTRFMAEFEQRVAAGDFMPGTQLPSERELTEIYGVARNTLRRALDMLESHGKIVRVAGKGAFVNDPNPVELKRARVDTLIGRLAMTTSPADVLDAQLVVEPQAARIAVANATDSELRALESLVLANERATNIAEYEYWDSKLHHAIVTASHNALLVTLYEVIDGLRHDSIWGGLKITGRTLQHRQVYQMQHRDIVKALRQRDGERAAQHMQGHIQTVRTVLLGHPL